MTDDRATLFGGGGAAAHRAGDHAGRGVVDALAAHGTEVLFTLCGGHVLPILDACVDAGIRVVDTRHEQAAVLAAAGYAYATRTTGVAAVTAGPGFTNAVTGIADANHSGVPLVVLGGRTPLRSWSRDAIQDVDQLAIARTIAKRARTCFEAERLGEFVADAFWHARAGRPGVSYLDLPTDVLLAAPGDVAWRHGFPETTPTPKASDADLERALDLLQTAERPVVVCGSGPFWGRADEALARFAERTNIPVTTTGPARGLLPDDHPGCLGGLVHGGLAVVSADVVVVLGSRFDGNLLFGGPPLFGSQIVIQVDIRAEAFGGNRKPDLAVQGDAAQVLDQLAAAWTAPPRSDWLEQARELAVASREAWDADASKPASGVHPGALAREVDAAVDGARTLVTDGGDILTWAIAFFGAQRPGSVLTTGTALGTLGVGVPFAVGAKVARPDEPSVLLVGDGSFGLAAMEVETAARHGLPMTVVISNNGAWGDVQHEQRNWFGRLVGSGLGFTRYERLAEMVDGFGVWVDDPAELRPALDKALAHDGVSIVNVRTDPEAVSEILRGIGQLGVM